MVKINSLEVENLKRIKACTVEPAESGLTVIGGNNGQGKTSTLDAIAWALGGEKFRPSNPNREGSALPPNIKVTLSNGIVVERKGKNSALKVSDPAGGRSGQQLLNDFVEQLALNLPKFMNSSNKEKADTLLRIIGVGDQVRALEAKEQELYNQRLLVGREADRKQKYADELQHYENVPEELVAVSELVRQQQDILARNGENQRKREQAQALLEQKKVLEEKLAEVRTAYETVCRDCDTAIQITKNLQDESTEELERSIREVDAINMKVRANLDRQKAMDEAYRYSAQYEGLSVEIEAVRKQKLELLSGAALPLDGLSVEQGELTYNGAKWDCMSGSDQLKAATAIVRAINPHCGFVLMDKLEQMDLTTLQEFGKWLEKENLQVIATRVSTGDECSIIIEDGYSVPAADGTKKWKEGVF